MAEDTNTELEDDAEDLIGEVPAEGAPPESPDDAAAAAEAASAQSKPSLADAVDAALAEATKPRGTTVARDPVTGKFLAETPEQKTAREKTEAAAKAANETPEQKAAREKAEADTAAAQANETPEQKKAREQAEREKAITDPIPKDINERTAKRMQILVDEVKGLHKVRDDHGQLMGYINSTGASPQEFSQALSYMRAVHSDDPKALQSAYEMLQSELLGLAEKLGHPIPEVNLLNRPEYKDLLDEVNAKKITPQRAHELAVLRSRASSQTARAASAKQTEEQTRQRTEAIEGGKTALNTLEDTLIKRDGPKVYAAKCEVVYAALESLWPTTHPSRWAMMFQRAYDQLKWAPPPEPTPEEKAAEAAAAAAAAAKNGGARPTPLRPKQPAGGSAPAEPKSAVEAMTAALAGL